MKNNLRNGKDRSVAIYVCVCVLVYCFKDYGTLESYLAWDYAATLTFGRMIDEDRRELC